MRTHALVLTTALALGALPSLARAEDPAILEATVGIGIADRSSTGIGDPLLGMGYDQSFGPLGAVDLRLFLPSDFRYVRHGPVLRGGYQAGPSFGAESHAFRTTTFDLGYSGRAEFPCMRRGDASVHLGGFLAITGIVSDAGRGDRTMPDTENQTLEASSRLDHGGLGGALGLNLDVHYGAFVIGVGVDLHQWFGIDTLVARDLMLAAQIRLGADITL